jgi:hypothetical protein
VRRMFRAVIVSMLVSGLAATAAPMAAAADPVSIVRPRAVAAVARAGVEGVLRDGVAGLGVFRPVEGRVIDDRELHASWQVRAEGSRFRRWSFDLIRGSYGVAFLSIATERLHRPSNTLQAYAWDVRIKPRDVRYSRDLRRLRIRIEDLPGRLGTIRLRSTATGRLRSGEIRCPSSGKLLATRSARSSRLEGRLRIAPGASGLPRRVTASTVRTEVEEYVFTGRRCRETSGGCRPASYFVVETDSAGLFATRRGELGALRISGTPRLFRLWLMLHQVVDWPVPLGLGGGTATIEQGMPHGSFHGSLAFTKRTTTDTERFGGCRLTADHYDWDSGSMTAAFDAGPVVFTGSELRAAWVRFRRV